MLGINFGQFYFREQEKQLKPTINMFSCSLIRMWFRWWKMISDALLYYCCVSSAKFLLKKKYPHHFHSRWNAGSQFLAEKQIREMLPSLSVVKASSGEDHLCVSELLVGSFAFGVHAMNFVVPSFAYEVRTTWCILGFLRPVRYLGKIQAFISNWCHVERLWWFGRLSWPLLLIVYFFFFFGRDGWHGPWTL